MRKLVTSLLLAAALQAAPVATVSAQQASNTLRWSSEAALAVVDPYFTASREGAIIDAQLVWDTLVYRDPESGDYKPLLAKSWKWVDDVTLEFELRDDVKFHDGKPFTSDDVVYTYNYVANPANKVNVQSNVSFIKEAVATGPYGVRLILKRPFPAALEYIASVHAILPKDFYGAGGVAGGNGRLVGTGPYKISQFVPGNTVELTKSGTYFKDSPKGDPKLNTIVYKSIPDMSTQIANLLSGNLDWIWYVPKDQVKPLQAQKNITVAQAETMRVSFLAFNLRDKAGGNPLKDIRVRQAIGHAIDRDLIIKEIVGGGTSVLKSPCYKTQFGCGKEGTQLAYDPALSKKLLAEAGFAKGLTLELVAYRNRDWIEAIAGFLNEVGIKTNVSVLQWPSVRDRMVNNTIDLYMGDWGSYGVNDVSALYNAFFLQGPDDMAQDPELAKALQEAVGTTDKAARKEKYDFASERIQNQVYWFPLWPNPVTYAYRSDLQFRAYPDENPRFFQSSWK
jgi:peptide/nickel transport system substrate-binding protein